MSVNDTPAHRSRRIPKFMLRGFWDELVRRGVSSHELENASGVSRPKLGDFLTSLSGPEMHRLFVAGRQLTDDPRLGLTVGRAMGTSSFHLVGHMVLASPSLAKAIELVTHVQPHFGPRVPRLDPIEGDCLRFGVVGGDSTPSAGAQIEMELTAVHLYDVARLFLDDRFASPTMQFAFRAPADLRPYRRVFSGELEFGCEGTFCIFPRSALRRRSGADAGLLNHFFSLAREHYGYASEKEDWTSRVRSALRSHPAPRLVEPGELSAQLGLSTRAMSRRLGREGVTLSKLVDDVLFDRARAALRRPGVTAGQVAEELGYAELSSFFRAFRRWSGGLTPKQYRERNEL